MKCLESKTMNNHHIDEKIIQRDGPFVEFKQDTSVVSVKLASGEEYPQILLLYPNKIIGMKGAAKLSFYPSLVTRITDGEVTWINQYCEFVLVPN
ncbi:hypothetical protein CWI77_08530 [Pseudidiomarina planktonica]|nr:hypothetical protein CWI77_08530 [Pseudidiomarina planktonica]